MIEKTNNKKRRLILILLLLLVLFPTAFFLSRSLWENGDVSEITPQEIYVTNTTTINQPASATATLGATAIGIPTATLDTAYYQEQIGESFFLSMMDGNFIHLFIFDLSSSKLIRLTNNQWDDIDPALSPDGRMLAFSSNRNGYWDIYILNLRNQEIQQITDTKEYDAKPSWSPDNLWITYESYRNNNLEIQIISTQGDDTTPIFLTDNLAADHSPVWSPEGRTILFVSDRTGDAEIWAAHLGTTENRFENISLLPQSQDIDPTWSPDGNKIAWSSTNDGISKLIIEELSDSNKRVLALGKSPVFSTDSSLLLAQLDYPNEKIITCYIVENGNLFIPPIPVNGNLFGFSTAQTTEANAFLSLLPGDVTNYSPSQLWESNTAEGENPEVYQVVPLESIDAPYAYLHDAVNESFIAMHKQVEADIGWNFLDQLDEAYYPLTEPPPPDLPESWLYTGRAIEVNSMPLYGGWMSVVREDHAGQTYWRVFLKTRYQDGSQGRPIKNLVWDFSARSSGNPNSYEKGGEYASIPEGYWVDFTELALRYGWNRLPALINWRTYFSGTLFNQFVLDDNLDWFAAMSQLYPREALATATRIPTKTVTPTSTKIQTPTRTPTSTNTIVPTNTQQVTTTQRP